MSAVANGESTSNRLSIVIPSYNRPEKLLLTLRALSDQLVPGVSITVLDNCSKTPYESYCVGHDAELKSAVDRGVVRFVRHHANIGMSANFMRAFEISAAEWLWMVADDDTIMPDAVANILRETEALSGWPDIAFVKFSSRGCEAPATGGYVRGLEAFIDVLATSAVHFNSFIFISNGVYRLPKLQRHIEVGYSALHTYVPHLMMLLAFVAEHDGENCIYLSPKHLAAYVRPEQGYSYGFVAGLGVGAFKNFAFDLSKRQYRKLEAVFAAHNDFKVAIDLFYHARARSNMFVARTLVDNYWVQIRRARGLPHRAAFRAFVLLLYAPGLMERLICLLPTVWPASARHVAEMRAKYVQ